MTRILSKTTTKTTTANKAKPAHKATSKTKPTSKAKAVGPTRWTITDPAPHEPANDRRKVVAAAGNSNTASNTASNTGSNSNTGQQDRTQELFAVVLLDPGTRFPVFTVDDRMDEDRAYEVTCCAKEMVEGLELPYLVDYIPQDLSGAIVWQYIDEETREEMAEGEPSVEDLAKQLKRES